MPTKPDGLKGLFSSLLPDGFKVARKSARHMSRMQTDEEEVKRLHLQHYCCWLVMHGNFSAPAEEDLQRGIHVLDAGCGSGIWCIEMARDYPNSTFTGIDTANVFPNSSELPPNCIFQRANILGELPFKNAIFDYVFQRFMFTSFSPREWEIATKELVRVLKPGGWIESIEGNGHIERRPQDFRLYDAVVVYSQTRGIDFSYIHEIPALLANNNIVDIVSDYASLPFGWGGRVGDLYAQNARMAWYGPRENLLSILKLTKYEFEELVNKTFNEMKASKTWHKVHYVYGKKKLETLS